MVRKLFKYETAYYARTLSAVYIALLGVAVIGRIIAIFENESVGYSILRGSTIFALVVAMIGVTGLSFIFSIVRYYKSMYTGEGYLTHTLPVKSGTIINVKLVMAVLVNILSSVMCFVAFFIFTIGEWFNEFAKAGIYIVKNMFEDIPDEYMWRIIVYIIQMLPMLLVTLFGSLLLYYMCISIGQLFNKNRILAAIGVYFAIYMISQAIGTIFSIVFTVFFAEKLDQYLSTLTETQGLNLIHIVLAVALVIQIAMALLYYFIVRFINTKKLNLE